MKTEPEPTNSVEIQVDDLRWADQFPGLESHAKDVFTKVIQAASPDISAYQACLVFSNDKTIQSLNETYRNQKQPTNVLAFPADCSTVIDLPVKLLGDIIIAFETVDFEAQAQNKSFQDHTTHLIVHGALHLLGYDHIETREAEKMESFEIKILANMGIKNPYEDDNA